ncbi:MAG: hypothetical protein J0M30_14855 [Chitinophagales bacterium]|nr:hypothetical protein [Chitinophagales bacterium]
MKRLLNIICYSLCVLLLPLVGSAQYGVFDSITVNKSPNNGGNAPGDALLYKPTDYPTVGKRWPLIIDLHGAGEASNNLTILLTVGLPNNINAKGQKPILKYGSYSTEAFVLFPQSPPTTLSTEPNHLPNIIKSMLTNYPIDSTRIYLSGLSGGGNALGMIGGYSTAATYTDYNKFVAAIFMRSPHNASMSFDSAKRYDKWRPAIAFVWGGQSADGAYKVFSQRIADSLDNYLPGKIFTHEVAAWGHNNFIQTFDTAQRYSGIGNKNFYEFLASYTNQTDSTGTTWVPAGPSTTPPTANAGPDQTHKFPKGYVALYGGWPSFSQRSADGGPIVQWNWSLISGPNTPVFRRFQNEKYTDAPTNADSVWFVRNLTVGTYQFELRIVDSAGGTDRDTVQVVIENCAFNPSPKKITISNSTNLYRPFTAGTTLNIQPGDTIQLDATFFNDIETNAISWGNFGGCRTQPVVIRSINGRAKLRSLALANNGEGSTYNKVENVIVDSIESRQFVGYFVEGMEWKYCKVTRGFQSGFVLAGYDYTNALRRFPAHYINRIYLHDNEVDSTVNEGIYAGPSLTEAWNKANNPTGIAPFARMDSVYAYNNYFHNTGNDGMQFSGANNLQVFHNYVKVTGGGNMNGQGSGINVGTGSSGRIWKNIIDSAGQQAHFTNGHDTLIFEENYYLNCSYLRVDDPFPSVVYLSGSRIDYEANKSQRAFFRKNYFLDPYNTRTVELTDYNSLADPAKVDSNTFWLPNKDGVFPTDYILLSAAPGSTQQGNIEASFSLPVWQKNTNYNPTLLNPSGVVSGGGGEPSGPSPGIRIKRKFKIKTQ